GRDAQGGEAQLGQDLHARAVRLRVLRAVRPGVPDRRHHHDEVVRSRHRRSPRAAARQGSSARPRPPVRAVVGDGQQAAGHASPPQDAPGGGEDAGQGVGRVTLETLGFWTTAGVLLASSLGVVLTRNLFHSVLYLAVALVATAVEFLL